MSQTQHPRFDFRVMLPIAALVSALPPPPCEASPSPEQQAVAVLPPRCPFDLLDPFLDSLRVELAGSGRRCCALADSGDQPPADAALSVRLDLVPCVPDADRVQLTVSAPKGSRKVEREISLSDVAPKARARALALAVAETIRSYGQAAPVEPTSATAASAPRPTSPAVPARATAQSGTAIAYSIHVEGEARAFPARDTLMWGGRARLAATWRFLHVDLDLGGDLGSVRVEKSDLVGDVLVRSVSAGLGVGPRIATGAAIVDLGLHAELGWAWFRGESGDAAVEVGAGSDITSNLGLRLSLETPARLRVRPRLALEGGWVVRGVSGEANHQPVAGITGYYLVAALGIAISP